jgi:hypothetical protein
MTPLAPVWAVRVRHAHTVVVKWAHPCGLYSALSLSGCFTTKREAERMKRRWNIGHVNAEVVKLALVPWEDAPCAD